jgi:diguanylate cyclase (GGDEF)-like protein
MSDKRPSPPDVQSLRPACLVDAEGNILAGDVRIAAWLAAGGSTIAAEGGRLDQLIGAAAAGELLSHIRRGDAAAVAAPLVVGDGAGQSVEVAAQPWFGAAGPLALVSFNAAGAAEAFACDALTGLADRRAIAHRIAEWRRAAPGQPFAMLFLDLDGFKRVNDDYGHAAGDRALSELARRWAARLRAPDLAVRYGGDEFVVLLKDVDSMDRAHPVIERLQEATREPVELGDANIVVRATIGVALATASNETAEELIAAADRDMYARKRSVVRPA